MAHRTIPQRELRNNVGAVLRDAEAGETFTITVRGRPVASLGPPAEFNYPRVDVAWETFRDIVARTPVDADLAADLDAVEEPVVGPFEDE